MDKTLVKDVALFDEYGEIHNEFLTYMLKDYVIPNPIISFEQLKNDISKTAIHFVEHNSNLSLDENYVNQTTNFLSGEDLNTFIRSSYFREQINSFNESPDIHSLEKKVLNELLRGYLNDLSWDDYKTIVDNLTEEYNNSHFIKGSPEGDVSGVLLAISNHSIQWWTEHPEAYPKSEVENRLIPAWFAADIVGAIAGGLVSGLYQMYTTGCSSSNPCDIGGGALSGALFGSTGVISRVGRWIYKIFK